ncbi:hypothetical protein Tco_0391613, partial [Tanacetum coccineum]
MAALVCGGRIRGDKKNGSSGGVGTYSRERGACSNNCYVGQPPRKDPQMEYSKIVPQSEQKY